MVRFIITNFEDTDDLKTQVTLPYLRQSTRRGQTITLSSGCDSTVRYNGWMAYCTSKAALSRFIQMLAREEKGLRTQGVYPKLTGTQMPVDALAGKSKGIMSEEDMKIFTGLEVEPAEWCGVVVAKLAAGLERGLESGEIANYGEHIPRDRKSKL
jgi:NAD(P)-dependent dehydrogenase (short-subunit alcohol dehydrogenase family)